MDGVNMDTHFSSMNETVRSSRVPWWLIMIAGIAAFIVGVLLLISPGVSLVILVQLLGLYWLVTGILSIVSLFVDRSQWGWKLFAGILGILAGIIILRFPLWSALLIPTVLVLILAIQALIAGVIQIVHAFSGGGWGMGLLGGLNVIFGLILLFRLLPGVIALPIVLGIFAIIGGIAMFIGSFRLRRQEAPMQPPSVSQAG
jgi:uncharacterized membrane protein HdeD (DUF308 family)